MQRILFFVDVSFASGKIFGMAKGMEKICGIDRFYLKNPPESAIF